MNTNPSKWAIKVDQSVPEIAEWFNKNSQNNFVNFEGEKSGYLHYPKYSNLFHGSPKIKEGYTEISLKWFKENILKSMKEIIGYRLTKKEYESAARALLGRFSGLPLNELNIIAPKEKFSGSEMYVIIEKAGVLDLWFEPVYKKESVTLLIGDKKISVVIGKDKITVEEADISVIFLRNVLDTMKNHGKLREWNISFPSIKIGCTTLTIEELQSVIDEYNRINM